MPSDVLIPLIGGALIGLAASGMLLSIGRIMGVSGIVGGFLGLPAGDTSWRVAFLAGMFFAGVGIDIMAPEVFEYHVNRSMSMIAIAGLFVGFGTAMGGGCTSGHGVCGIGRFSKRSITATLIFIFTGMLTVFLLEQLGGRS